MLNNVEMPTIAFISMIKATCESLKAEQVFVFIAFYFYEQLESSYPVEFIMIKHTPQCQNYVFSSAASTE